MFARSGPTTVLVLSLLFIAFVVLLHIWGKFRLFCAQASMIECMYCKRFRICVLYMIRARKSSSVLFHHTMMMILWRLSTWSAWCARMRLRANGWSAALVWVD
eukprot:4285993-Prymnesium_polylepis.1